MSDMVHSIMGDGFIERRCCGQRAGFVNARLFTSEANARFCELQQRLGNAGSTIPKARPW